MEIPHLSLRDAKSQGSLEIHMDILPDMYEDLLALSILDASPDGNSVNVADVMRHGLSTYIKWRRSQPGFQDEVQAAIALRREAQAEQQAN